jgi:hypothetical protein
MLASGTLDGFPASKELPHSLNASVESTDAKAHRINDCELVDGGMHPIPRFLRVGCLLTGHLNSDRAIDTIVGTRNSASPL